MAVVGAIAVVGALTIAGCTSGSSSSSSLPDISQAAAAPEREMAGAPGGGATGAASAGTAADAAQEPASAAGDADSTGSLPASGQIAVPIDGSKVIRTADLSVRLQVEPVPPTADAAADREANAAARSAAVAQAGATVRSIATAAGGFQAGADGGGSQTTVTLRVPTDQYDTVLDKLTAIGDITSRSESSQDVTAQAADVNSRVESMTASVARVRALLAQATTIADVISIESELSVREANLESLQQQQAALNGQVAMSTISLNLTAVTVDPQATEPVVAENGFITGLNAGWATLVGLAGWLGSAFGALLPFLPLLAGGALLAWWLVRRNRRRRAVAASTSTPAASSTPDPTVGREAGQVTETAGVGSS
ncbi:MAG: DUF4349 domain-containing protein [Nakamurella sp.]